MNHKFEYSKIMFNNFIKYCKKIDGKFTDIISMNCIEIFTCVTIGIFTGRLLRKISCE